MTAVEWLPAPVPAAAEALAAGGQDRRLAVLLARRGVADAEAARAFLSPQVGDLHEPSLLAGLDEAVERLLRARADREKVALVGDYDVDGVTGTALLKAVFDKCGVETVAILPHRMVDGYGFQPVHAERAIQEGCRVVVTVDCGTTSIAAAETAVAAGLDVVVTDHHLPGAALPSGVVLVNPRRPDCQYPFEELSGAGLALKLGQAFARACDVGVDPRLLLRVACLGTIADLVPLRGENRVIAAIGLRELEQTRSRGLRALLRVAGVKPPYSAADVGYRLGPRLNAPGRLDSAERALELLLTRDARRAFELAAELDGWNRERQEHERQAAEEARAAALERPSLPAIVVGWSESWHQGVVGIAAGRLAKELHRPTVLFAVKGDEAVGSGRSLAGIHLHAFFERWRERLPRFGGHAQAIGLTVATSDLDVLRAEWEAAAAEEWAEIIAVRRYEYELDLEPRDVDAGLLAMIARLAPFGQGNAEPLVRIRGPLHLSSAPRRFGRGHLSCEGVGDDGARIRMVGWGWQDRADTLMQPFEAIGHLEEDRYRGGASLRLVDCRAAGQRESGTGHGWL